MSDRPRIELNTVQIVASMAAAVTGAVLTSYLGDGGTIVGTAVGSGASTAGFAVYKHYLARTKEKMAPVLVDRARQWGPITATQPSRGGTSPDTQATPGTRATPGNPSRTVASPYRASNGTDGRGVPPRYTSGAPADQTRPARAEDAPAWDPGDGQTRDFRRPGFVPRDLGPRAPGQGGDARPRDVEQADTQIARPLGTVRMGGAGYDGNGGPGGFPAGGPGNGPDGGSGPGRHGKASGTLSGIAATVRSHPRWVVTAVTTVAVFLVAMLVITLIEFGTGKPIDASVWGRKASGTTLGNVTGSHSKANVAPTDSSTPTQSATPGVGQTAPGPNSSATTAPTPSLVPSVSPSPGATSVAPSAPAQNAPAQ